MMGTWRWVRMICWWVGAAAAVSGVSGCGSPIQVSSRWGPGLRFSEATRTFDWAPAGREASGEGRPRNPQVDPMIREMVERHLAGKGYQKVSGAEPDFWVDYRVGRKVRGDLYGTGQFSDFTEGTLVLYAVNPADGVLIWAGSVKERIDDSQSPDEARKYLDRIIKAMVDTLPARKTGK